MSRVKQSENIKPEKIFSHASAFHKSYDMLVKSASPVDGARPDEQLIGIVAYPALVLSVFASELYLKSLLCMETGTVPNTHDLKKLFGGLKIATRRELDDLWDADIRLLERQPILDQIRLLLPGGDKFRPDLRYALEKGANAFMELRYFYEKERSYFLLSDFPFLLRKAILKRCPSWGSIVPKPSKGYLHGPGVLN
jgi:HEPN domain-containing protein